MAAAPEDAPLPGRTHRVAIHYCTGCRWMLRAAWTAQELLTTFEGDLAEVALLPAGSGVFRVFLDGALLWDRKERGGFPELKDLKQAVRDAVSPGRSLGHSDGRPAAGDAPAAPPVGGAP